MYVVAVFLASSIVAFVKVVSANGNESHVYGLADRNICGKGSCGLVPLSFLVAVQTRGATSWKWGIQRIQP